MTTNYIFKLVKNAFVNVVSEVAMESSPGPSTSSGSRAETDSRAQSSAVSTPRAGTISILASERVSFMLLHEKRWTVWQCICSSFITGVQCIPQRAALLKSMLNFLKKAIQDPAFSDGIRHGINSALNDALIFTLWLTERFYLLKVIFIAFVLSL